MTFPLSHSGSLPLHNKTVKSISCFNIFDVNKPSASSLWNYILDYTHFPTIRFVLKHCNINVSIKGIVHPDIYF